MILSLCHKHKSYQNDREWKEATVRVFWRRRRETYRMWKNTLLQSVQIFTQISDFDYHVFLKLWFVYIFILCYCVTCKCFEVQCSHIMFFSISCSDAYSKLTMENSGISRHLPEGGEEVCMPLLTCTFFIRLRLHTPYH